jgi:RHS repeat-associated protein
MFWSTLAGTRETIMNRLVFTATIVTLLLCSAAGTFAQSEPADGSTALALAPGAPAGSYSLSGFENINPYSGGLSFKMPLYAVTGRGEAQYTITKKIERKWTIDRFFDEFELDWKYFPQAGDPWAIYTPGYGAGVMQGRHGGSITTMNCNRGGGLIDKLYTKTLTRLTFTTPDGTEYDFRDKLTDGAPATVPVCATSGFSRGKVFVSADGTAMTFISDNTISDQHLVGDSGPFTVSGYLMLADGTRFRILNGFIQWIRDRNGNNVSFTYQFPSGGGLTLITDSLNRQITPSNGVTFKGAGGNSRSVQISTASLGTLLRTGYSLQTYFSLFPELDGSQTQFNPTVTSAITLPNSQQYRFFYNSYGELARVELPTGGAIEYDWAAGLTNSNASGAVDLGPAFGGSNNWQIYRRVVERRVYPNGGAGNSYASRMTFSRPETIDGSLNIQSVGYVTVDQYNSAGTLLTREKHYYFGSAGASLKVHSGVSYAGWKESKEYKTESFHTDGSTVLRRIEHTWQQPLSGVSWPLTTAETSDTAKENSPQITQTLITLEPGSANLVAKQTFTYDKYLNRTDEYEYGFGAGAPGALVRRTNTTYVTTNTVGGITYDYACDPATNCNASATIGNVIHLRSLPKQISIYDSAGIERGRTVNEFDNYTADTTHAALSSRSGISGLDSAFTTSYVTRGNPSGSTQYLLNSSGVVTGSVSSYQQYDVAGNVVKTIDGRGNATTYAYDDCFGAADGNARLNSAPIELSSVSQVSYGFATSATNAQSHIAFAQFDYYIGASVDSEDVNGIVTSRYFNDSLDRPTQVRRAVSTTAANQTTLSYDDGTHTVTTTSDKVANNDNLLVSKVVYDGFGRSIEQRQYEGGTNYIAVQQQYDALGRLEKVSNPFRPYLSETAVWTTSVFDALGRVTSVTTPDNSVVTTAYSGNAVTVTDATGKPRRSITDALGRLTRVDEPNTSNSLGDVSSPNQPTSYSYDVLDNLTAVTQGVQTRTFVYDSLKRLTSVTNPETGTISYGYDANGNLTSRIDARSITTTITYDTINRVTSRSYNDSPQTPTVSYFYDAQTLPGGAPSYSRGYSTGRLVAVTYGAGSSAGTYRGFDAMGRVVTQYQRTDSVNYLIEATYYANSSLQTQKYPSVPGAGDRRLVSYTNDAAGRLSSLSSVATSYAPAASVSSIGYAAHNALNTETYGNGLIHAIAYNNRLRPTQIKLGISGNPTSVVSLGYSYGTTNNNGNVQTHTYAGGGLSYTQNFGYDSLNRLTTSNENGTNWSQTNGYDRYGNRWIDLGGGNQSLFFNTANNRLSGWSYDAAGNLLNDGAHSYAYDAENKVAKVDNVSAYTYDGEGQRVRKLVAENLRFIYGISDQLICEFSGSTGALLKEYVYGASGLLATIEPAAINTNGTRYITADQLGSPRVLTNSGGSVISRHDYMPFGDELGAGVGGRTTGMGFPGTSDNLRQKFTGYERDSESSLDYAINRYFHAQQGRFESPDSYNIVFEKEKGRNYQERQQLFMSYAVEPQIWNKYSYANNNPLKFTDPDGRRPLTEEDKRRLKVLWEKAEAVKQLDPALYAAINEAIVQIAAAIDAVPDGQADPANLRAVFWAIDNLGNTSYGLNGSVSNGYTATVEAGRWKCNIFVANAYAIGGGVGWEGSGVPTNSSRLGSLIGRRWPSDANTLASPTATVKNFVVVAAPDMGDIVAFPQPAPQLGHSAIFAGGSTSGGVVIYASINDVKLNTVTGTQSGVASSSVTFRRYKP